MGCCRQNIFCREQYLHTVTGQPHVYLGISKLNLAEAQTILASDIQKRILAAGSSYNQAANHGIAVSGKVEDRRRTAP